ncbi:efflux RND transporter periplasmic adaptor subunit [Alteromonas sp. a30]|uniref:efflux RND transporter periplasmic adaptor subunit n=1 Tax=Alteromonas sp. a30 TaxID=2730917 RepID=UPI00228211BD|nr:efflux RND transporter periplasmic adaptor subunit [Alteromonas sp. a30]MCY7294613.1 efflux RND transporter periplasmic adaptor subunit [Alteromonas sp. a30]
MSKVINKFRKEPHWLALLIFIVLVVWVMSGLSSENTPQNEKKNMEHVTEVQKVRTTMLYAEQVDQEVRIYGRTEPDRVATLSAEVRGQVLEILVPEGQTVTKGQALVRLDENDLRQRLASVNASLQQALIELKGAKKLGKQGYQSEVVQAQAAASVADAKARKKALELDLANTVIRAPFDGVMNVQFIEVGDYLREGDQIATIVDLDPLVIKADVTERFVQELSVDLKAKGRLVSGRSLDGYVRYISSLSQMGTNTFKVEVAVPNPDSTLRAGMSTELVIPIRTELAMKVTPAVMALDEKGNLGVKTVENGHVKFVPIDMVKSDSSGVWLTGLGEQAEVITLGQGFVRDGDPVEVVKDLKIGSEIGASEKVGNVSAGEAE